MSLLNDLNPTVSDAIEGADVLRDLTYIEVADGTYDPSTISKSGDSTTPHTCKGVGTSFEDKYIDGDTVKRSDRKILILQSTLDVPAQVGHAVEDVNGDRYEIINRDKDPMNILWILQGR